jgi:FAD/FMN-containing dehydrogenase
MLPRPATASGRTLAVRREILAVAQECITPDKFNHDVVVPKARVPRLFDVCRGTSGAFSLRSVFGTSETAIFTLTSWCPPETGEIERAHQAERALFRGVSRLEGSISGEHGIGFSKAPYLPIELSAEPLRPCAP